MPGLVPLRGCSCSLLCYKVGPDPQQKRPARGGQPTRSQRPLENVHMNENTVGAHGQQPPLILASGSPRRRELLSRLNVPFTVEVSDVDETPRPDEGPEDLAQRLALAKARS